MQTHDLAKERYVSLTTYRKDGTPKLAPVWPVDAGEGKVGFITSAETWKIKRLKNNSSVTLRASDSRGRPKDGTVAVSGSAEVVEGSEFEAMKQAVKNKYGYQLGIINFMHALPGTKTGHPNDRAVIITLDEH